MALRFIADMNVSPKTVHDLQVQGWNIIRLPQVLPINTADADILVWARQENRVIITHDLDFSQLVALSGYRYPSLITLRLSTAEPDWVTQRLLEILPDVEELLDNGGAVTIEDDKMRVRQLPIIRLVSKRSKGI